MNPYVRLPRVPLLFDRQNFVVERCGGRRVLHVGCVDAELLEDRFVRGELLHARIAAVADDVWGVDIDENGIQFLREHGFKNVSVGDVCEPGWMAPLAGREFDLVIATEVIEHLSNPGVFLDSLKGVLQSDRTEIVISVPNAFRVATLLNLFRNMEYVHPDHNYWFSYHTITNLLRKHGFAAEETYSYSFDARPLTKSASSLWRRRGIRSRPNAPSTSSGAVVSGLLRSLPRRLIARILCRISPFWGDGIIVVARLRG